MKIRRITSALLFALAMMPTITSCGDDNPAIPDGGKEDNPIINSDKSGDKVWNAPEQKEYLNDVGMELVGKIVANDFRPYANLGQYINDQYIDNEDFSWDRLSEWGEDILDDLKGSLIGTSTVNTYWGLEHYNNYKAVIFASNFTGHWTAGIHGWKYTEADNLVFTFNNSKGQICNLTLNTSGKVTKVHAFNYDDWQDDSYNYATGKWDDYYDRVEYTIGVPEKIEVTLDENGTRQITQSITIDLSSISNEEFDLAKSKISFTSETKFSNNYLIKVKNVAYSSTSATADIAINKGKERLVATTVSTGLSGIPSATIKSLYDMDEDDIEDLFADVNANSIVFSVDALGLIQIKGSCSNVRSLADYLEEADDNDDDGTKFKHAIEKANGCYEAYLYFNGGKAKQANFALAPYKETSYWGSYEEWYCEPVIKFGDGTSYSFEDYFSEDYFKYLIDAFEDLESSFEDLLD